MSEVLVVYSGLLVGEYEYLCRRVFGFLLAPAQVLKMSLQEKWAARRVGADVALLLSGYYFCLSL